MASDTKSQAPSQHELGQEMAGKFLGQQFYDKIVASLKDDIFTNISMDYVHEVCFASYARPDLEFRERCLLNLGMLIALNRGPELRIHIRAAVNNGLTEKQICEACRHAMIYCGVPAGRDALIIASEVFEQLKQSGQDSK